MQGNSFDCLAQLQATPVAGPKRRRSRRGKGAAQAQASPGGSDQAGTLGRQDSEGLALGDVPDDDSLNLSTESVPAALCSPRDLLRQSSDGCLSSPRQDLGGAAVTGAPEPAESAAAGPPQRSKSDLGSLAEQLGLSVGEAAGPPPTLEPSPSSPRQLQQAAAAAAVLQQPQLQRPAPQPAAVLQPRAPLRRRASMSGAIFQPFSDYLSAELIPGPSYPVADVVWGQTERDRVYNAILAVPYQLERFLWFGMLVCLDSFLAIFTLLPVRFAYALFTAARDFAASGREPAGAQQQQQQQTPQQRQASASLDGSSHSSSAGNGPSASLPSSGAATDPTASAAPPATPAVTAGRRRLLRGDQLYDLLGVLIFLGTVLFLWRLNAGALYFWMKDLTQEFLKLSVLFTALELSDKICCNFGVDVLEALAASCTQFMAAPSWASREAFNLASDVVVAALLVLVHGVALMSHAMVFGVAMNSKKNALVALLIAANFTEIKGTVLKRFDSSKLYVLACQDVVERFHLLITLAFVVVEEMGSSGHTTPNRRILVQCCQIFVSEAVIDVIKHAVLGKFNEIRPGVYREFMKDLCERVSGAQSHNIHKLVGFEPFAPTALAFRIAVSYMALRHQSLSRASAGQVAAAAASAVTAWACLFAAKLVLGYLLKQASACYVRHYEQKRGAPKGRGGDRRVTMAGLGSFPGPGGSGSAAAAVTAATASAPGKKEE